MRNLPRVLSPTHFGFMTPDCERLFPTIAPRGSARKTGLMISEYKGYGQSRSWFAKIVVIVTKGSLSEEEC